MCKFNIVFLCCGHVLYNFTEASTPACDLAKPCNVPKLACMDGFELISVAEVSGDLCENCQRGKMLGPDPYLSNLKKIVALLQHKLANVPRNADRQLTETARGAVNFLLRISGKYARKESRPAVYELRKDIAFAVECLDEAFEEKEVEELGFILPSFTSSSSEASTDASNKTSKSSGATSFSEGTIEKQLGFFPRAAPNSPVHGTITPAFNTARGVIWAQAQVSRLAPTAEQRAEAAVAVHFLGRQFWECDICGIECFCSGLED